MQYDIDYSSYNKLIAAVRSMGANVDKLINTAIRASALRVQATARSNAPHRTGTLQRSIIPEFSNLYGEVKVNEKYGLFIEEGTDPFTIEPRNKKALFWPGADHPVKSVRHPGIKAKPFFAPAIKSSQVFIGKQFDKVVETIVNGIAERVKL